MTEGETQKDRRACPLDMAGAKHKSEGSAARVIRGGLVGPKPRAKAVGDGQSVNIPIPSIGRGRDAEG